MKLFLQTLLLLVSTVVAAQTQVSGTVTDANGQPVPGANVVIDNTTGTVTDFDGNFSLNTSKTPPFTLTVSSVGLETKSVSVTSAMQSLRITLGETTTQLDEIVVSASRMAERIFESPVTVEKFSLQQIERTPSADYFNGLENIKGIQLNQGGLVFNQVSTRGFATVYNEGFVTLVDGMNNQAPIFGFGMGNLVGLNELDVQSVEVLPGAASALYGADAYKGIMFLNSKNPFEYEGVSAYYKTGVTQQAAAGNNEFTDFGIRMATKLSDKWAVKATFSHKQGTEWAATDYRHVGVDGKIDASITPDNPNYNGVNVYGENTFTSQTQWGALYSLTGNAAINSLAMAAPNYFDNIRFNGVKEVDFVSPEATNTKGNFAIHFRPNQNTEVSLSSLIGTGDSPLQGTGRYAIRDFKIEQHKLEVNSGGFMGRAYLTRERAGNSYQMDATATLLGVEWFKTYLQTYLGGLALARGYNPLTNGLPLLLNDVAVHISTTGGTESINALFGGSTQPFHQAATAAADTAYAPGSSQFNAALNQINSTSLPATSGGARVQDDTRVYNYEFSYNLGDKIDFADIIIGGQYQQFELNTGGTIYTDYDGPIEYNQYGAYAQAKKDLFNDFVSLTASLRYDKSEFFNANITPRVGLLFNISDSQNVRLSYQKGFRNPTNQDQYIGLYAGTGVLFGTSPDSVRRYDQMVPLRDGTTTRITGADVFATALNLDGTPANLKNVKAELVTSIDLGYRYNSAGFSVDFGAYYSDYSDYIGTQNVMVASPAAIAGNPANILPAIQAGKFQGFAADANLDVDMAAYGASVEVTQALTQNLFANAIYEYNSLDYTPTAGSSFETAFNTPEHRIKLGLNGKFDAISFNVNARYNSEYMFESTFVDEMIDANTVLDAQLTLDLAKLNAKLRVGGNNIGGNEFVSLAGSGRIGSIYYTSILFDL